MSKKFGDSVKKKVGNDYDPSRQGIEDAEYLYLPDSSTHDIPTTEYRIPKELSKAGRPGIGWDSAGPSKKRRK